MYTLQNFKSKKELKTAVDGRQDGTFCFEGPHYPEAHRWYATCTAKDGVITGVK